MDTYAHGVRALDTPVGTIITLQLLLVKKFKDIQTHHCQTNSFFFILLYLVYYKLWAHQAWNTLSTRELYVKLYLDRLRRKALYGI